MTRFVVQRVLLGVLVLWVVTVVTFGATALSPVNPVDVYAGRFATPAVRLQIRHEFKLDRPLPIRYLAYLRQLLSGNLGRSINTGESVVDRERASAPATVELAVAGLIAEVLIGVPLGVLAALRRGSRLDKTILFLSLTGALAPVFVVGFLLLYVLAFRAGLFPIGGYGHFSNLVLPALTLGLAGAPWLARMMRSTMLDVTSQEYVRAARARGASPRRIVLRHILPNALNPVITMLGLDAGVFFAGVLVIEQVFAWPGIGQQAWQAVSQNDFPMIMGSVLFAATAIVGFNLVADVANVLIDPRIRRR